MRDENVGTTGRYELREPLGRGAGGIVFAARDRRRGGTVAVKMLDSLDPKTLFALKNEFRSLADTAHPNLASLHELVCEGEHWYLAMELVEGGDFLSYVRRSGDPIADALTTDEPVGFSDASTNQADGRTPRELVGAAFARAASQAAAPSVREIVVQQAPGFDEARLRRAMAELASGVFALHTAGKVHRDLKPSNVLVRANGSIAIVDFGLVQSTARVLSSAPQTASVAGTPLYVAPEVLMGTLSSPASDWYAVGVMLYEALTGRPPYAGSPHAVLFGKVQRDPVPIAECVYGAPLDLVRVCESLMARNPDKRPTGPEVLAMLGAAAHSGSISGASGVVVSSELFVGREHELALLRAAFGEASEHGVTRTVIVRGPSGIGKSRLVESFLAEVRADPRCVVLAGRCYERETVPFKAMDTIVDALSSYLMAEPYAFVESLIPRHLAALCRAFPVLERVGAIADERSELPRNVDPQRLRMQAFDALRALLGSVAERRALVLVLDDVQWGDGDSASMFSHLLAEPDAPPLLFVACQRDGDEQDGVLVRAIRALALTGAANAHSAVGAPAATGATGAPAATGATLRELALAPLPVGEVGDLVRNWMPEASPALVALVAREAEGSPFYITSFARYLSGHGEAYALLEEGALGIRDVLGQTHALLDAPARRLLATVCVAKEPLAEEVVEQAAEIPHARAVPILKRLRALHLIRAPGGESREDLEPYHGRVRQFVVGELDAESRRGLHRAIAIALETTVAPEPSLLAEHWLGAGDRERACTYTVSAADRAGEALAFDRAARLYRTAIELTPDDAKERIRKLMLAMGDALANAGRGAEAAPLLLMAATDTTPHEKLELERRAAEQWLFSGRLADGLSVLEEVLVAAGTRRPAGTGAQLRELVWKRAKLGFRSLALRADARPSDEQRLRIDACRTAAWAMSVVDLLEGAVFQARQVEYALDAGDPHRVAMALAWHGAILGSSGPSSRKAVDRHIDAARRILAGRDDAHGGAFIDLSAGTAAVMSGEYRGGLELLGRAERVLADECRGVTWELGITRLFSASCLAYLGRWALLRERLDEWLADARRRGDLYASTNMILHESTTFVALARDDVAGARHAFESASQAWEIVPGTSQHFYLQVVPSYLDLYEGEHERARARLAPFVPAFARSPLGRVVAQECQLRFVRALAELGAGSPRGLGIARADARFLAGSGLAYGRVTSALLRASLASRDGAPDRKAKELRLAIAEADAAGLAIFGACAAFELASGASFDSPDERDAVHKLARGRLASEGVIAPERLVRTFIPV